MAPAPGVACALALATVCAAATSEPGARQRALLQRPQSAEQLQTDRLKTSKEMIIAAGCFWGVQLAFARIPGVLFTDVGYIGGRAADATYHAVSRGTTRHAEALRIGYDPTQVSYAELLGVFFDIHDPTTLNRQGNDVGTQYRSAIFVADEEERRIAQAAIEAESMRLSKNVATTIEELVAFYPAEEYHQHYLEKGGQTAKKGSMDPISCYG